MQYWESYTGLKTMRTSVYLLTTILLLQCKQVPEKLYTLLDPAKTGVSFSNDITIADSLVLSGYEYIYNGGGVAVGDINNDGLQDLYFTGNLVSSRLYLNKSITTNGHTEIVFEDITEKAGVGTKTWANGVTMVDINQDGYKDIYVSVG
ncbi:MAG: VCBS repeat-containing protein, partial [Saprospiraceae bacterium]